MRNFYFKGVSRFTMGKFVFKDGNCSVPDEDYKEFLACKEELLFEDQIRIMEVAKPVKDKRLKTKTTKGEVVNSDAGEKEQEELTKAEGVLDSLVVK